ncbi:MAG: T9SS type A sorting domain-containing protein [Saprospiraceae bacterium]|nr:T9SS type A sorting domain-containing protein [Saprospiraceae bacterium]
MPVPRDTSKYYLFHKRADNSTLSKDLLLTQIDMSLGSGLGAVTSKNEIILQDTFSDFLTAVRHGNGRDWWVMLHKNRSNRSLCYLLDPAGLHAPIVQHLGPIWNYQDWAGQSVFSPDGSRYARANPNNGLSVFDFDRCAGTLSNHLFISLAADSASACGVAFSPNSRFLYLSTGTKLFQFDMQAADIAASKQLIGVYDGFLAPFPTTFYQQRLAPDGKIYMNSTNGVNHLHVINNPDLPGLECNFVQHEIELPTYSQTAIVNFPYFRLYDLPGSPCDTLGIDGGPVSSGELSAGAEVTWRVSPNPAVDEINISFSQPFSGVVTLLDTTGQTVKSVNVQAVDGVLLGINVSDLPNGIYYLQVNGGGARPFVSKVVIAH